MNDFVSIMPNFARDLNNLADVKSEEDIEKVENSSCVQIPEKTTEEALGDICKVASEQAFLVGEIECLIFDSFRKEKK